MNINSYKNIDQLEDLLNNVKESNDLPKNASGGRVFQTVDKQEFSLDEVVTKLNEIVKTTITTVEENPIERDQKIQRIIGRIRSLEIKERAAEQEEQAIPTRTLVPLGLKKWAQGIADVASWANPWTFDRGKILTQIAAEHPLVPGTPSDEGIATSSQSLEATSPLTSSPSEERATISEDDLLSAVSDDIPENEKIDFVPAFKPYTGVQLPPDKSLLQKNNFMEYILAKDDKGFQRIFQLTNESVLNVLDLIKKEGITIDLHKMSSDGKSLFIKLVELEEPEIVKKLLEIDPSVIEQIQSQKKSYIMEYALEGSQSEELKEMVDLLIKSAEERNIPLTQEEEWIKKAFYNDCSFSEEEFKLLDNELKAKVYFVANAFANEEIVRKLNPLVDEKPIRLPGSSILAYNMDIVTAKNVMGNFLKDLGQSDSLISEEDFSRLQYEKNYSPNGGGVDYILGKQYIERHVVENGLRHIKIPKMIAVIPEGAESISLKLVKDKDSVSFSTNNLVTYAERVKNVDRKLSFEEALECLTLYEKTGYLCGASDDLIIAEDGIYFTKTGSERFKPKDFSFDFQAIKRLLDPKDVDNFMAEYQKRKEAFDSEKRLRDEQESVYRKMVSDPLKNLVANRFDFGYHNQPFTFPTSSLV